MKLFRYLFIAILAIGFASCGNDDDEDDVNTNQMKYGEVNTKIAGAAAMELEFDSYTQYQLILYGEGVSITKTGESGATLSGSGVCLAMYLISFDKTLEGVYTYSEPLGLLSATTESRADIIPPGDIFLYNNLVQIENGSQTNVILGTFNNSQTTFTITKTGNEYEIVMKGEDNAGNDANAYYKGEIATIIVSNPT